MVLVRDKSGFTLIEIVITLTVMTTLAGVASLTIPGAMRRYALNTSAQTVATAIRSARYVAVSKNRTVRVRFDCPATDQFRVVEFVGTPAIDDAVDRCSETAYPYPDTNPAVAPNVDGPVILLPRDGQFGSVPDLEIDTAGRVTPLNGCPTCVPLAPPAAVIIGNGYETTTITVSATGQVLLP